MAQSILVNTAVATIGRAVNVALSLVAVKLLTRFLGPAGYGSYALLLSFGMLWQLLADFGLYLQLTRSLAEKTNRHSELISTIFSLRLILLVVVFIMGALAANIIPSLIPLRIPFLIIALGLIFQSLSQLYMGIFQYQQNMWQATLGDILGRLSQIAVIIFLAARAPNLSSMTMAFAASCGVALLVHHLAARRHTPRFTIAWATWKELLRSSWPLGALLVLNAIYFRIDTVILSLFRTATEVGEYSLAYRIIESALFLPAMFGGLLLPRLTAALARGQSTVVQQYISQGLTVMVIVAAFTLTTLLMKASAVIIFIADASFLPAAPLLVILSFALACMFFGNIFGFALIALKKQTTILTLYATLAVANTVGNFLTIPVWGSSAAAVTTLLTEVTATLVGGWIVWRLIPYRIPLHSLFGTIAGVLVCALVYHLLPSSWPLLFTLATAAVAFGATLIATQTLTRQQLSLLSTTASDG